MDIEAPWISEMNRTGTCREYETYYSIGYNDDRDEEDSEEIDE